MSQSTIGSQAKRHQAFTTIELLVVIGIIVILASLVFVGVHHVGRPARENSTRATLANLQGMLADLEAASGLRKQPGFWLWTNGTVIGRAAPGPSAVPAITLDFWKSPAVNAGTFDCLASPGTVSAEGVGPADNQRNGSIAVVNTCLAMAMMSTLPENRTRLQGMQQNQLFVPEWKSGSITLPGADRFIGFSSDGSGDLQYVPGMHVKYQGKQFVGAPTLTANNTAPPGGGWVDETNAQNPAPLLVDAWNNPIIFVPASGMRVRLLNGKKEYSSSDATQNYIVISPEGAVLNNGTATPMVTRVGRPFFASAGADGDFTTGDDNVYSFEK